MSEFLWFLCGFLSCFIAIIGGAIFENYMKNKFAETIALWLAMEMKKIKDSPSAIADKGTE